MKVLMLPLLILSACAPRMAPYHFRGPGMGGVAAARLPVLYAHRDNVRAKPRYRRAGPPPFLSGRTATFLLSAVSDARASEAHADPQLPVATGPVRTQTSPVLLAITDPGKLVAAPSVAALAQVGERTQDDAFAFARRNLKQLGAQLRPELARQETGQDFAQVLVEKKLLRTQMSPVLGDLVVFDEGSIMGMVTGSRHDGTAEFVYAQDGVVRRGWVNGLYVRSKRDAQGRVLNTFIRPLGRRDRHDQRYLAGELFSGFVRLDEIVDPPSVHLAALPSQTP